MQLVDLLEHWHSSFGPDDPEVIVRSPGRVNIIGEHTDYNEGWVMPGAMSKGMYILVSRGQPPRPLNPPPPLNGAIQHHWISDDLNEEFVWEENAPFPDDAPLWCKYMHGAVNIFLSENPSAFPPFRPSALLIGGDLPIGAGVSSSSSLVSGLMLALHALTHDSRSRMEIAQLSSRVEREIIGLQGGIMDQYAILLSQKDQVMLLDCRAKTYEFLPASIPGTEWLLLNTKVKHQLIDSDYNKRGNQCKEAVSLMKKDFPSIQSLRDVTMEMLSKSNLPDVLMKRSQFVVEENARVQAMKRALADQDPVTAGKLLAESHEGLKNKYEVSCDELDHLAALANQTKGVYGARMMGGGFGGCVICLVEEHRVGDFLALAKSSYRAEFGFEPEVIQFTLSDGAYVVGDPPSEANSPAIAKKMWRDDP